MAQAPQKVGIIVDPEFGERLHALAARMPLWVADTPANRAAAEANRRTHPAAFDGMGVTTIRIDPEEEPAEWAAEVLSLVLEHHGEYAQDPPVSVLEFIGTEPTPALRELLAEYGFSVVQPIAAGFRACAA